MPRRKIPKMSKLQQREVRSAFASLLGTWERSRARNPAPPDPITTVDHGDRISIHIRGLDPAERAAERERRIQAIEDSIDDAEDGE